MKTLTGLVVASVLVVVGAGALAGPFQARDTGTTSQEWPKSPRRKVGGFVYPPGPQGSQYEVLGACSLTDGRGSCWGTTGLKDGDMTAGFQAAVDKGTTPIATVAGQKNRYAVVRLTQFHTQADPLVVRGFGDDDDRGNWLNLGEDRIGTGPTQVYSTVFAMPVATDQAQTTASLVLTQTVSLAPRPKIDFRTGASTTIDKRVLTLKSVQSGAHAPFFAFTSQEGRWWTIEFACDQPKDDVAEFYVLAFGKDDKQIGYCDLEGNPASGRAVSEARNRQLQANKGRWVPGTSLNPPGFRLAVENYGHGQPPDSAQFLLGVNPKYVAKLEIRGYVRRQVELAPVPLDPLGP